MNHQRSTIAAPNGNAGKNRPLLLVPGLDILPYGIDAGTIAGCTVIHFITAAFFPPGTKGSHLKETGEFFERKDNTPA